jgi:hypothetical protein
VVIDFSLASTINTFHIFDRRKVSLFYRFFNLAVSFVSTIFPVVGTRKTQFCSVMPINDLTVANPAKVSHFCLSAIQESTTAFAKCVIVESADSFSIDKQQFFQRQAS